MKVSTVPLNLPVDLVKKIVIRVCRAVKLSEKGKKRHSYSVSTKLEAIAYAESNGKEAAARKFHVDAKRIREWCQKKAELETSANPMKRLHSGGRKPLSMSLRKERSSGSMI